MGIFLNYLPSSGLGWGGRGFLVTLRDFRSAGVLGAVRE